MRASPPLPTHNDARNAREFLELLAVIDAPMEVAQLASILKELGENAPSSAVQRILQDFGTIRLVNATRGGGSRIAPTIATELLHSAVETDRIRRYARAIRRVFPDRARLIRQSQASHHDFLWESRDHALTDLRVALFTDEATFASWLSAFEQLFPAKTADTDPIVSLLGLPPNATLLGHVPTRLLAHFVAPALARASSTQGIDLGHDFWTNVEELFLSEQRTDAEWRNFGATLVTEWLLRGGGRNDTAPPPASTIPSGAIVQKTRTVGSARIPAENESFAIFRSAIRDRFREGEGVVPAFDLLSQRRDACAQVLQRSLRVFFETERILASADYAKRKAAAVVQAGDVDGQLLRTLASARCGATRAAAIPSGPQATLWSPLLAGLSHLASSTSVQPQDLAHLEAEAARASKLGRTWLAAEYAALLAECSSNNARRSGWKTRAESFFQKSSGSFAGRCRSLEPWQQVLAGLTALQATSASKASAYDHVAWLLSRPRNSRSPSALTPSLTPFLAQRTQGKVALGRSVSLKQLSSEYSAILSAQDRALLAAARGDRLQPGDAWPFLIGHPCVFWDDNTRTPLSIQSARLGVVREQTGEVIRLRTEPPLSSLHVAATGLFAVEVVSEEQLDVFTLDDATRRILELVSQDAVFPTHASTAVDAALGGIASTVDVLRSDDEHTGQADPTTVLLLRPQGQTVSVRPCVEPLAALSSWVRESRCFPPGEGPLVVSARVDKNLCTVRRDLKAEARRLENVLQQLPMLNNEQRDGIEFNISTVAALQLLDRCEELATLGEIRVRWPSGERITLHRSAGASPLAVRVKREESWFDIDGTLTLDNGAVLALRDLLARARKPHGNFIELAPGHFAKLNSELLDTLQSLVSFAEPDRFEHGDGLRLGTFAVMSLAESLEDNTHFSLDDAFRSQLRGLRASAAEASEWLPIAESLGFRATLRPYQHEGITWMMRLAAFGFGACLADDMGLGKTLQTIAVLSARASLGPALVVAPLSVANNWLTELARFNPQLRCNLCPSQNREGWLASLTAGDVAIVSYGTLTADEALFSSKSFATLVLDEAQAIKNADTRRAQAAFNLQADFRIALSGTPIENHLGEVWSLFRFLCPGLLGSQKDFANRYLHSSERRSGQSSRADDSGNGTALLRRRLQPFLLRRTKSEVLKELPPRTEVTLLISPTEQEKALYEAARREALERLEKNSQESEGGKGNHIEVLAELTRLRLAACHPELVLPGSGLESSKLETLVRLVLELRDNGHRALIFSQFVKLLTLCRERLLAEGITMQYLDGQCRPNDRAKSVAAFQAGTSDVFLISLKAGGSGLNLTAADYVVHLDPWWNPAVEDQASDRAHRLGQTRPVTVYRLVAQDTVEERIVRLHEHKRDIAEALLSDTSVPKNFSARDLRDLLED